MSIASEITSIGENLKKDYQAIANLGADLTNVDKNIENIAELLDGVYDNLPKTEYQEGADITIENGLKGKLDFENGVVGYGQTEQESTQGYQLYLLPPSKTINGITYTNNGDGTCDIVGTATANVDIALTNRIPIAESPIQLGATYNISVLEALPDVTFQVVEYASNSTWIATTGLIRNAQSQNITIPNNSNVAFIDYNIRVYSGATVNAKGIKLMMNNGTTRKDFEPYTNGASPNPSYPQEIKYVRGRNLWGGFSYSATGAQMTFTYNVDGTFLLNGTATSDATSMSSSVATSNGYTKRLKKGSYVLSGGTGSYKLQLVTNVNGYYDVTAVSEGSSVVVNLSNDCDGFLRIAVSSGTSATNQKIYAMLEEGTQATPYLPYNTIEEVVSGKNLFEPVLTNAGTTITRNNVSSISVNDGEFTFVASGSDMYFGNVIATGGSYANERGIKIYRNGNEKISYKCTNNLFAKNYICAFDSNGISLGYSSTLSYEGTYTFPNNCEYITFRFGKGDSVSGTTYKTKVILAYGDTIPDYEPYKTPKIYELSLGDKELFEECTIVGSPDNWKFVDNWYKLTSSVLSGLTIGLSGSDGKKFVVVKSNFVGVPAPKVGKVYCTHLKYNPSAWYADGYCGIVSPGATLWIQMTQVFESVEAFKTFITTNNMEFVYQTEEPVETPITDTTLIEQLNNWYYGQSLDGTTIIEGNGDLPMIIKVRGLKGE